MSSIPMLMCKSVSEAAKWYCRFPGMENDHDGDEFDRIFLHGDLILMLHHWTDGEHGLLPPVQGGRLGDGIAIWIKVDDLNEFLECAKTMKAEIVAEPWFNEQAQWREATVRDLNGYTLCLHE